MAKQQHIKANMVLKYLRWGNTDARGECALGYDGKVFNLDPSSSLSTVVCLSAIAALPSTLGLRADSSKPL